MKRTAVAMLLLLTGCRPVGDDVTLGADGELTTPLPAAAVVSLPDSARLADQLSRLAQELAAAAEADGSDELMERMLRAEAITDRLLEQEPDVAWLPTDYSVESRLRQLQVMADRVLSLLRRSASASDVQDEIAEIRSAVVTLRGEVQGLMGGAGGAAPPPLDTLLKDTAAFRRALTRPEDDVRGQVAAEGRATQPAAPRGPRLLGTPVDTGG